MKTSLFPARSRQGAKLRDTASTFNFFSRILRRTKNESSQQSHQGGADFILEIELKEVNGLLSSCMTSRTYTWYSFQAPIPKICSIQCFILLLKE